jgi:6-pyruvoyltetrahydropterin/6-carboxytetrahydropterin synthase
VSRLAIVELHKEELKFSAGHFMVFSASQRESIHGHDYQIGVALYAEIANNGMSFDMRAYKQKLLDLCRSLDYHFLLPSQSEFLRLEDAGDKWLAHVNGDTLPFLKKDAKVLPVCNITLEEVSNWFLQQLLSNADGLKQDKIRGIIVKAFNGRGESGGSSWGNVQA